jgi:uncharacterized protein YegJ (DUF2314 family)
MIQEYFSDLFEAYAIRESGMMSTYKRGEYVEAELRDEATREREWMWVLVADSDDEKRLVFGRLDNEPVVHTNMRLGMELAVSYDSIREHRAASSFNQ